MSTIKRKVKDNYSREEVKEIIEKHSLFIDSCIDYDAIISACCSVPSPDWDDEIFIEENL